MNVDALVPNDSRVEHKFLSVGDLTYHYLLAKPTGERKDIVFLVHGWYIHLYSILQESNY